MADRFATTCRPEPGLKCLGPTNAPPRLGRRGHPASSWARPHDELCQDFTVIDSRLAFYTDRQDAPPPVFIAATGQRLPVGVPRYDGETPGIFQWLDDDRFAMVVHGTAGIGRVPTGDLLVCRISAGRCHTVASGEQDWLLPGAFGGVGAEG